MQHVVTLLIDSNNILEVDKLLKYFEGHLKNEFTNIYAINVVKSELVPTLKAEKIE